MLWCVLPQGSLKEKLQHDVIRMLAVPPPFFNTHHLRKCKCSRRGVKIWELPQFSKTISRKKGLFCPSQRGERKYSKLKREAEKSAKKNPSSRSQRTGSFLLHKIWKNKSSRINKNKNWNLAFLLTIPLFCPIEEEFHCHWNQPPEGFNSEWQSSFVFFLAF